MRKASLTELAGKATMNAQPFIEGLRTMDRETKKTTAGMDSTWDKFSRGFTKKWNAKSFGSQVAKGLGVGSGFAVMDKAVDALVAPFAAAAEAAKKWEEVTAKALANVQASIGATQTDAERLASVQRLIERQSRELKAWDNTKLGSNMNPLNWWDNYKAWLNDTDRTELATLNVQELTQSLSELGRVEAELKAKMSGDKERRHLALIDKVIEAEDKMIKGAAGAQRAIGNYRIDPLALNERKFSLMGQITEMKDQQALFGEDWETHQQKILAMTNEVIRIDQQLLREERRVAEEAERMGNTIASSFENAVLSGGKLSDMLRSIGEDLLRMAFRSQITTPLGNWLGDVFKGFRADGGPVSAGSAYVVGERGPELFVPTASGSIIPNGGGGPRISVNFAPSFQTGVTRQEVAALLPRMVDAAKAAVADAVQRGGAYRRAMA